VRDPFVLSGGGRFTVIDIPAVAYGINNNRVVVGTTGDSNGSKLGFIATPVKPSLQ